MAKSSTMYVCDECGGESTAWAGKCSHCGAWNSLKKISIQPGLTAARKGSGGASASSIVSLNSLTTSETPRFSSGITELDLVLGGGFVPGSLVLLGGDPGIGKSTLALQSALLLSAQKRSVLYISGEESASQIKLRKDRVDTKTDLKVLAENDLEHIIDQLIRTDAELVVIDSIQTVFSSLIQGVAGGVAQVAYATNQILKVVKQKNIATLLIGHVTKEGNLAGPKTLEHMVDAVLYLEGERYGSYRILRAIKNRFGSVGEVGVFEMLQHGLVEVKNPGAMFLEHRTESSPGTAITAALEGNKVILLEIQSLCVKSNLNYPKRATSGYDVSRLQLILAIITKNLKLSFDELDVYVNVAGGFSLDDRASDLAVALSIITSYLEIKLPQDTVVFGELGLLGEVRKVPLADKREKEAKKLEFKNIISPSKYTHISDVVRNIKK